MVNGKTKLVTGSTSGIGLGIACSPAVQGAHVILSGFGASGILPQLSAALAEHSGVSVRYNDADMGKPAAIAAMMAKALSAFGCIDLLINNAGIQHVAPVDEFPVEKWSAIRAITLSAGFQSTRLALLAMKQQGFGRIANSAAAHAQVASPHKSACLTAKHGVAGFNKTVALEVAARDISADEAICNVLLAAKPAEKRVTTAQVAALTCFWCTGDAASITGAILPIEGTWTAH